MPSKANLCFLDHLTEEIWLGLEEADDVVRLVCRGCDISVKVCENYSHFALAK